MNEHKERGVFSTTPWFSTTLTLSRVGDGDMLMVRTRTNDNIDEEEAMRRITIACTLWVDNHEEGREALEDSGHNFDVAALHYHYDQIPKSCLEAAGLLSLRVELPYENNPGNYHYDVSMINLEMEGLPDYDPEEV